MLSALLYLRLTSLKNVLRSRLLRLRQPKYLLGAVVGAAYFWFFFFRPMGGVMHPPFPPGAGGLPEAVGGTVSLGPSLGALLLLAMLTLAWVLPTEKPGLPFTEAEAAFLFPAPLSRRALIHFKLLGSQFTILITALFFTLLSSRWRGDGGNALTHAVGWWVILSTLNLHQAGAVLTLTRLIERGVSPVRRRVAVFGGLALVVAATVAWVWRDLRAPTDAELAGVEPLTFYLSTLLNGGALGLLLWPLKLVLGPFLAADAADFLLALAPALLVMGAHYFWVMRMNVAFEEASLGLAEKRGAAIAAWRSGKRATFRTPAKGRRPPFALADTGRPELAFLWKNLLSTVAWLNARTFRLCAVVIVVGGLWLTRHPDWHASQMTIGIFALIAGAYILLLGPQIARQDLRGDLANADILKTYPLPGWQLLLGELLAPVAILSGLLWLALLTAGLALVPDDGLAEWLTPGLRLTGGACLALLAPPLLALQLLVPNAAVVVFPGWFQSGRTRGGGIDVMGQRLIFVFGQMILIVLALLPAALVALGAVVTLFWIIGLPTALCCATAGVLVILFGELWLGLTWLGKRFEKLDLSAELQP